MGKRKQRAPVRATEEKRKCLSWNMLDGEAEGSVSVIPDNDSSLKGKSFQAADSLKPNEAASDSLIPTMKDDLMDIFDLHVENCEFSITILKESDLKKRAWSCKLGDFRVQFSPGPLFFPLPTELPDSVHFTLHVGNEGDKSIFCYNSCDHGSRTPGKNKSKHKPVVRDIKFWLVDVDLPRDCLEALRCRSFQVVLESFRTESMAMVMKILGTEAALTKLTCPSEAVRPKGVNQSLLKLMKHFYRVVAPDYEDLPYTRKHDIDELYAVIKRRHDMDLRPILPDVQHADLFPVLRLYQQAGITWMIYKEKQDAWDNKGHLHMLYTEVITKDGQTLYYNRYAGVLVRERPVSVLPSPGGILGDEMGLGKTVEVLALILHHPRDCVPEPHPLPVVEDEEIPKKLKWIGKERKKRKRKKQKSVEDSDSDDTIIYSDEMDASCDLKNQSCDGTDESCDKLSQSDEISEAGSLNANNSYKESAKAIQNVEDMLIGQIDEDQEHTRDKCTKDESGSDEVETGKKRDVLCNGNVERTADCDMSEKTDLLLDDDSELNGCDGSRPGKTENRGKDIVSQVDGYYRNIFTEMPESHREEFECICGAGRTASPRRGRKRLHPVQCVTCGLWQHAECVNYDLKDPLRGEFKCPHCHVSSRPVVSGATLIISPFSIAHQWVDEILKHVAKESLNVFMYTGVNKQGFIQPRTLARQDIVITTYETLRKELDYVDLPHSNSDKGRKLRYPKRFMALPSPMVAVEWWRICLDEAQMVECTTTKTAEMALRLTAVNRWCITGTPVQKGIDDLYGLLLFLGVDPYWVQQWWGKLLYDPFCHGVREPLYDLLTSVLWRTIKTDVLDQIDIPGQTEHLQWLTFSPVEEHFYRRQYRDCVKLSMERLSKWTDSSMRLSSLDRHTVNQLLYPLVRLRQACCHPQAVRGEFIPIQKSTMTMEELLESLTKKARLEAEESHRALVAAINGQAGLHIIREEFVEAVEKYREVLRSVEEHKDKLHTDSLQQLHAMYNLSEILSSKPQGVAPTLRDGLLEKQVTELKDKYMAKAIAYVKGTEEALAPLQMDVKELQREFNDGSEWWLEVIQWTVRRGQDDMLVMKVRDDLLDNRNPAIDTLVRSCRNAIGLQYSIEVKLSGIHQAYTALLKAMKGLRDPPSTKLINQTTECCLRPVAEILKTCPFCKSEELFETYEAKLFSFVEKGIEHTVDKTGYQVNARRQGTWADSEVEKALKSILSFAKSLKAPDDLIEFGSVHIKLFDAMKKEYRKLRTHWAGIKEHVGSFDELDMSTTRLRLRLPDEPVPDTPQLNILEKSELTQHKLKLSSDRIVAQGELRKKLGQLLYLTNLAKNQADNKEGDNPEPCPICQTELGKEWSVMQCGHCFCLECIKIMADRASFGRQRFSVKCAVCRQTTYQSEISFVTTKTELSFDSEDVRVLGSHSTKVEAIVRCLLKIKREDPHAKSLVFSTWTDVLSVIARALDENDIKYRALYAAGKFQQSLSSFKQCEDVTTLLLPVHSGANGLNLIEATNVLLVEPILNPAQELQAIGRVHRIGQSKPTHVYRFLVRGTIEQKMQMLLKSMDMKNTATNSEESGLTIGDLSSLFAQQLEDDNREGVQSMDESETPSPSSDPAGPTFQPVPSTSGGTDVCRAVDEAPVDGCEESVHNVNERSDENPSTSFAFPAQTRPAFSGSTSSAISTSSSSALSASTCDIISTNPAVSISTSPAVSISTYCAITTSSRSDISTSTSSTVSSGSPIVPSGDCIGEVEQPVPSTNFATSSSSVTDQGIDGSKSSSETVAPQGVVDVSPLTTTVSNVMIVPTPRVAIPDFSATFEHSIDEHLSSPGSSPSISVNAASAYSSSALNHNKPLTTSEVLSSATMTSSISSSASLATSAVSSAIATQVSDESYPCNPTTMSSDSGISSFSDLESSNTPTVTDSVSEPSAGSMEISEDHVEAKSPDAGLVSSPPGVTDPDYCKKASITETEASHLAPSVDSDMDIVNQAEAVVTVTEANDAEL